MKILSMTATFGKLSQQTLNLDQGMNIFEAPNEWGKSTWCAFIMAMLYGIDTTARSKTGYLADKEHYAPWSGEPMSGRMEILWNGREITIERKLKGRAPMSEVKAFETQTGIEIPELCVAAPGQVILGVERSVFARAGFLKLSDMPVTEDDALRRRLNELVTTGDESGASDTLAQKLKDLKNRCRFNRKGLLPEQEARLYAVQQRLAHYRELDAQATVARQRRDVLQTQLEALQNHKQALEYADYLQDMKKVEDAKVAYEATLEKVAQAEQLCAELEPQETIEQTLIDIKHLRDSRESLHTKVQLLPAPPQMPAVPEPFRGKDPDTLVKTAKQDREALAELRELQKNPLFYALGGAGFLAGLLVLLLVRLLAVKIVGGVLGLAGIALIVVGLIRRQKLQDQINQITVRYRGIPVDSWESDANDYVMSLRRYELLVDFRKEGHDAVIRELEENAKAISNITGGLGLAQFEENCRKAQQKYAALTAAQKDAQQAKAVLEALEGSCKVVEPPAFEDNLSWSIKETARLLTDSAMEQQILHQKVGQLEGQMETMDTEEAMMQEEERLRERIQALELHYRALVRAQETMVMATQELQRRFAPRIARRAQELFGRLTGQRYKRLNLTQDLSVEIGAEGENVLRNSLWRSDGTVDQLYMALRMAVAEELTPDAPLILDDVLSRFDDVRATEALKILREESKRKQVILFTCQSREKILEELI